MKRNSEKVIRKMKKNKKSQVGLAWAMISLVVGTAIIFCAILGFDSVDANHLGVMIRLGKIQGTMDSGIKWTGILTHTEQYDMRIRKSKVDMLDEQSSATDSGGQAIFGSVSVNYKLKGVRSASNNVVQSLYANVGRDAVISDILNIEPIIKEGFKQATVEWEAIEILQNRQAVKEQAIENIRNNFPEEYFEIVDIVVEDIDFSTDFKLAIEQKKIATQNKLKEEEQVEVVKFQQQQEIEVYKAEAEKLRLQKAEVNELLNQQRMLDKWNGVLPQYLIITDDSQGLFLQLAKGELSGEPK